MIFFKLTINKAEQIKSLLHSYADWQTIGNKKQPYHIEIRKGDQFLYYFGSNHSRDPQNFQYPELKKYWQDFLEKTHSKNSIFLGEGGIRKISKDENMAIHKDAEGGLVTLLAHQAQISIESPEPNSHDERQELVKQFSKEEVQYYYFARTVHQWLNIPDSRPDYKEYMSRFLVRDEKDSRWAGFDFSFENMERIHKTIFGTDFNYQDRDFFYSIINPTKDTSIINTVAGACSLYRNIYIVARIEELWKGGKNIFVVFGFAHLILQERALRKLLN